MTLSDDDIHWLLVAVDKLDERPESNPEKIESLADAPGVEDNTL